MEKMPDREGGNPGLLPSRIGFGCMSIGMDQPVASRLLQTAAAEGITFFDTADLYNGGENERIVGKALKEKRKQIVLATKVGNQLNPDGKTWRWNPSREYILHAVEESLKRLQTDYIDLYQLHGGTLDDDIDDTIATFELLKKQGKIRHYGISSIRPAVIRAFCSRTTLSTVMMQYSLLDRRPEEACLGYLSDKKTGILARGALAGGLLINKPATDYLGHPAATVRKAAAAIRDVAGTSRLPSAIATRYVLHEFNVKSAVTGIRTMEQLQQALAALAASPLTSAEISFLREAVPLNYYGVHR